MVGAIFHLSTIVSKPPLHAPYRLEKNGEFIEITLHHAGHVAGAVSVNVKYNRKSVFFTGDILFNDQRTLDGANLPKEPVDILVTETTRGATEIPKNQSRESEIVRMLRQMNSTLAKHGSVLVPVFALGRMQEMLAVLDEAFRKKPYPRFRFFAQAWAWIWLITSTRFQKTQIVFASTVKS